MSITDFPLMPGDILIPQSGYYSYCLKVDKISPDCEWMEKGFTHVELTRYDLSEDREPVMKGRDSMHLHGLRYVGDGIYRDRYDDHPEKGGPAKLYKLWMPKSGQLNLDFCMSGEVGV